MATSTTLAEAESLLRVGIHRLSLATQTLRIDLTVTNRPTTGTATSIVGSLAVSALTSISVSSPMTTPQEILRPQLQNGLGKVFSPRARFAQRWKLRITTP